MKIDNGKLKRKITMNELDKEIMRNRLIDLTKRDIDLVELIDLTIYNVKREVEVNLQDNFQIHYWVKEPFNNKEGNSQHVLYRRNEGETYEILSLLIRMEEHYDGEGKQLLPE